MEGRAEEGEKKREFVYYLVTLYCDVPKIKMTAIHVAVMSGAK